MRLSVTSKVSLRITAAAALALALAAPSMGKDGGLHYGKFGIDLTAKKAGVKPGDDFWAFANGGWDERTPIAPDRQSAGVSVVLADQAEQQVKQLLTDLAAKPDLYGAKGKKIGDMYASWMDEAAIEARGTAPLKPYLDKIAAVKDLNELQVLFATTGFDSPIGIQIIPDLADPTRYIAAAGQAGLGMGNRDYYLLEGEKYDTYRKAYRAYLIEIQTLAGIADAAAKADRIIALETALAKEHWSPEQNRNIAAIYNPMNREQMEALAPEFDWNLMMKTAGLESIQTVIMAQKTAITATGKMLTSTPLDTWKEWMAAHFISSNAPFLPKAFDQASFNFFSKTLSGTPTQRERWKRGIQIVNGALGEAVGEIYVQRHFPPSSKTQMEELIADLRASLEERLKANKWMDEATKTKALEKLAAFEPRVGYPEKFIDYSALKVERGDLLGNAQRSAQFEWNLELSRLGKPVDRSLWGMTPQTVNAYYSPLANQITFPAAILQPPYFDPTADPAVNYGAIGAVIGHEIGHGFDDQGSQFDAKGKFSNWWTKEAKAAFEARTKVLGEQFGEYEPLAGVKINPKLTMGENIGDLGGIEMAYGAYQRYQAKHGKAKVIDGLTGDQRFFLAYAQAWRTKLREDALRNRLLTDPHSPAYYRVNGIVRNVDAWYTAFNIQPGDKMYLPPEKRVKIW